MKPIICFDVDGTLVDGVSWIILTLGLSVDPQELQRIFNNAQESRITFDEAERELTTLYRRSGNATKSRIHRIFEQVPLRPEVPSLMNDLRKKGYRIYLISGGVDLYVEDVASKLNADGWYANARLQFDENDTLIKIHYESNQTAMKVTQLQDLAKHEGVAVTDIVCVGDGDNDIGLFQITHKGIAVHTTDPAVLKAAWKIAASLSDIPELL